ncbi:MAG TPA: TolC family protein, partial [Myxococcota bacterium]|nr:TolC family protein [Myxococcota bacterium]
ESGYNFNARLNASNSPFSSQLMLNLSWPLWNLESLGSAEANRIRQKNSELTLTHRTMEKELSVNSALASIKAYGQAVDKDLSILEFSSQSVASTERLFNLGESTGLEVIDANVRHFSNKSQLQEDTLKLKHSNLRLLFLIGKIAEF